MKILARRLATGAFSIAARALKRVLPSHEYSCTAPVSIHRILFIRLDHIGDVVMSLPALRALRQRFPDTQIDVLVRPDCAPLLNGNTDTNRVLIYDTPRFPHKKNGRGRGAGLFRTLLLIRRLRRARYDVAIDGRGDDIARLLACFSGAPFRLGPDRVFYEDKDHPNFSFLMSCVVPLPEAPPDVPRHAVEANCALLQSLGVDAVAPSFNFAVTLQKRAIVEAKLSTLDIENFVAIHACSNDPKRNWTIEGFAQVADYLVEKHNFDVVLTGVASDREHNNRIIAQMHSLKRAHNVAGLFILEELPAFFERAVLMVSVDTGPMHIAAFSGTHSNDESFNRTPIVALFLPFLAPRHHPYGQKDGVVLPSHEYSCDGTLKDLEVEAVIAAIEKKLN